MPRILICTGVLGGGTAIVFLLAALTASLFPHGNVVAAGWNGGLMRVEGDVGFGNARLIGPGQDFVVDGPAPMPVGDP